MIEILLPLLAVAASIEDGYLPSQDQDRVDRSFSEIPIDAPLAQVAHRLAQIVEHQCDRWGECEWGDAAGVRYSLDGNGPDDLRIVAKRIEAADYAGREIPALGIGVARERDAVLAAARRFVRAADFECGVPDGDGREVCNATLGPGWVTIRFAPSGSLIEVQLDGYHFT